MSTTQINNTIVDLSTLPPTTPSMCIPRVFSNITKDRIFNVLKDLNIGFIERIDQVFRTNDAGARFQRVFIHIHWNDDELSNKARTRLLQGKEIKIIYDDPWFWKVSANRSVARDTQKEVGVGGLGTRGLPTLQLGDDEDREEANMQNIKRKNQQHAGGGGRGGKGGKGGGRKNTTPVGDVAAAASNFAEDENEDVAIATHDLSQEIVFSKPPLVRTDTIAGISRPVLARTMTSVDVSIDDELEEGEVRDDPVV